MTLDAGVALDLLAAAVSRRGPGATRRCTGEPGIVESVFRDLPASQDCIDRVRTRDLRSLYLRGQLPAGTTVGAVIVLRRAQLAERTGAPWGVVLERALDAAQSVFDIAPAHLTAREKTQSADRSRARVGRPSVAAHASHHPHPDGELP